MVFFDYIRINRPKLKKMKKTLSPILFSLFILLSCETEKKAAINDLPMQIAHAYGFDQLDDVQSISYTWNVRRDSATVMVRDWEWDLVKKRIKSKTLTINSSMTSIGYCIHFNWLGTKGSQLK